MDTENIKQLLFVQQRFQILHLGKHFDEFSGSYLYARERGVYPYFDDTDGSVNRKPHELYPEFFSVSKEEVKFLTDRFNTAWDNGEKLTFISWRMNYMLPVILILAGQEVNCYV